MKPIFTNHFKFYLTDSRHNFFHRLVVVSIRTAYSLIFLPLSLYLAAIGYSLTANTIEPYLPEALTEKVRFYSAQLPFFPFVEKSIFARLGYWYKDAFVWWGMVVGIPLMAMAISIFFANVFNLYYSIFNNLYNSTHCPFCKEPIKMTSSAD